MEQNVGTYLIFVLILRVVGLFYCINKAKTLNRSQWGWGFWGFVVPIIAMIWISFLKPVIIWDKNVNSQIDTD